MENFKKAAHIAANILLWVLIVVIAFFAVVTFTAKGDGKVTGLFGYSPMIVLTDSMADTFHADDLIIVKKGDGASYQVDDIISFWTIIENQRVINTHRIVERVESGDMVQYVTRGDANSANDNLIVSSNEVVGKYVFSIPFLGKVLAVLSSSIGFLLIIVLPLLAFFLYELYRFIMLLIDVKKQTALEAAEEAAAAQPDMAKLAAENAKLAAENARLAADAEKAKAAVGASTSDKDDNKTL